METIRILSYEEKPTDNGAYRMLVKTDKGLMACWDMEVAKRIKEVEGKYVAAELHVNGKFTNIRDIGSVVAPEFQPAIAEKMTDIPLGEKDKSIISQVVVKCAAEMWANEKGTIDVSMGQYLCEATNELIGAYKLAYSLLD